MSAEGSERDVSLWIAMAIGLGLVVAAFNLAAAPVAGGDLQLGAPEVHPANTPIPVHAFHFGEHRGEMGDAESVRVRAERNGETVAESTLHRGESFAYFGALEGLPEGMYTLEAEAQGTNTPPASVSRPLRVGPNEGVRLRGRIQGELQQLRVGPLHGAQADDPALEVRVSGGACVPDLPCELWILLGEHRAPLILRNAVGLRSASGACVLEDAEAAVDEVASEGIGRCELTTFGNEASFSLHAADLYREVQLPIALATPRIELESRLVRLGERPEESESVELVPSTVRDASRGERRFLGEGEWPALEEEGVWRLQARRDAFGSAHVATRLVVVGEPALSIASRSRLDGQLPRRDPLLEAVLAAECEVECDERKLAFLLAAGEGYVADYAGRSSGKTQAAARRAEKDGRLRAIAVTLILLGGLIVGAAVVRRGMRAEAQARALFPDRKALPPSRVPWLGGAFVFAMFALAAALSFSRGCVVVSAPVAQPQSTP